MTPEAAPSGQVPSQLCVRDSLFLLAHDQDRDMAPRLLPAVLDLALAASTLIDLTLNGRVRIAYTGGVYPTGYELVGDVVTQSILDTLRAATSHQQPGRGGPGTLPLPEAFAVLCPGLVERTRAHLVAGGVLITHRRRFGRVRYALAASTTMGFALSAPRIVVLDRVFDPYGLALCALVQALQLHPALYLTSRSHLDPQLIHVVDGMRAMGGQMSLIPVITDALRHESENLLLGVYR